MTEPMALPPPLARVPSGVPGLDVILHGGFLGGGIYILQGRLALARPSSATRSRSIMSQLVGVASI